MSGDGDNDLLSSVDGVSRFVGELREVGDGGSGKGLGWWRVDTMMRLR